MKRGRGKVSEVHLPPEIISKILSFLPVKPLLRFRCVSKWWDSLICSPEFTKEHLECSAKTKLNKKLILCKYITSYCATVDEQKNHIGINAVHQEPPLDFQCERMEWQYEGFCRGLLLFSYRKSLLLWNPFTRTHHILPYVPQGGKIFKEKTYGFGYDEPHDDYKVVRVGRDIGEDYESRVTVFSLNSNSWKRVSDFPHYVRSYHTVFVNGAVHYVVYSLPKKSDVREQDVMESDCLIASFDIADETYRLVPQPDCNSQHLAPSIGELGGCLCMIRHDYIDELIQVWVMEECGVRDSWTELFRLKRGDYPWDSAAPITYLQSETQVLFLCGDMICCVDLSTRSSTRVEIYGTERDEDEALKFNEFNDVCVCTESLVLLDSDDSCVYDDATESDDNSDDGGVYDDSTESDDNSSEDGGVYDDATGSDDTNQSEQS